ncbi:MAG: PEP/pyruvate-binding domain-containing protein [Pseudomonadota bacterium]
MSALNLDDSSAGGKAQGLAGLVAEGMPVPDAVVLPVQVFRQALAAVGGLPPDLSDQALAGVASRLRSAPFPTGMSEELDGAARALGGRVAVRSSATFEDRATSLAPGIFRSYLGIVAGEPLHDAVRGVWASLYEPPSAAYHRARGLSLREVGMAVLIQREILGAIAGTTYTRAPGGGEGAPILIELAGTGRNTEIVLVDRASSREPEGEEPLRARTSERGQLTLATATPRLEPETALAIAAAAIDVERILGCPADVEWVLDGERLWIVQARPESLAVTPDRNASFPDEALAFSRAEPAIWTWDAAHNPEPLSPAQEGLIQLVETNRAASVRQAVVCGYLYFTGLGAPPPLRHIAPARLAEVFASEIRPELEQALELLEAEVPPDLEQALAAYLQFYRIYARALAPALATCRRELLEYLAGRLGAREAPAAAFRLLSGLVASPLEHLLREASRENASREAIRRLAGPLSPAWDVAAPTYAENPAVLEAALAQIRNLVEAPPSLHVAVSEEERIHHQVDRCDRAAFGAILANARAAAVIGEEDDLLFARAQAGVRRALAKLAHEWSVSLDDLVHAPLETVRAAAAAATAAATATAGRPRPPDLESTARAGREQRNLRRRYQPPLHIVNGMGVTSPETVPAPGVLRGRGTGGRASGLVCKVEGATIGAQEGPASLPDHSVLVAATITPAMAPFVVGAAAIVTEYGGLLGHGASLARELGVPCVVDCPGALALADGERVLVDADAGFVVRLALYG